MLGNKNVEQKPRGGAKPPRVGVVRQYGRDSGWQAVLDDPRPGGGAIAVGSAAWFAWLAAPSTQSFGYPVYDTCAGYIVGFMTVRKERRARGGAYWVAYRRTQGRVRKVYVGGSVRLTQQALEELAQRFLAADTRAPRSDGTDGDSDAEGGDGASGAVGMRAGHEHARPDGPIRMGGARPRADTRKGGDEHAGEPLTISGQAD